MYLCRKKIELIIRAMNFSEYIMPSDPPFDNIDINKINGPSIKDYYIKINENPLQITISRISTQEIIFSLDSREFIYSMPYK